MAKYIKQEFGVFTKAETSQILNQRIKDSYFNEKFNDLLIMNDESQSKEWQDILKMISDKIGPHVERYTKDLMGLFKTQAARISHLGFMSDANGSFTENHFDEEIIIYKGQLITRPIIVLIYINDGYEGGELMFPLEGFTGRTDEGSIIIFPSGFAFPHLSAPVTTNRKHLCRVTYTVKNECYTTDRME